MNRIHKGGRPIKQRPEGFYERLLEEYESMSYRQLAECHGVSTHTIWRWLQTARRRANQDEQTES